MKIEVEFSDYLGTRGQTRWKWVTTSPTDPERYNGADSAPTLCEAMKDAGRWIAENTPKHP